MDRRCIGNRNWEQDMILSVVEVTFKDGQAEAGLEAVRESIKTTRAFDGCLGIDVGRPLDNPNRLVLVEKWTSAEHDAAYRKFRATQGPSRLGEFIAGPPAASVCEILSDV